MLKPNFPFQALRCSSLALSLALAGPVCVAQDAQRPADTTSSSSQSSGADAPSQSLPSAPSALLAEQSVQRAGSSMQFHAGGTIAGPAGAVVEQPTAGPLPLSLDDAITLGLDRNVSLKYQHANQREVRGDELGVVNALLPSLTATAQAQAQELNLAALGFKPSALGPILAQFGLSAATFPTIVKVNTLQAQVSARQELFDLPAYELYLGSKNESKVVDLNVLNARGDLVLSVGTAYLRVLADQSAVTNAQSQERAARTNFEQSTARRDAGVGTNLDVLRAQVDYQQRQQQTISAQTTLAKDTVQLNRIMGLPAGQQLELTDTAPFNLLEDLDPQQALTTAFAHRKDLLSLEQQISVDDRELRAVRYQRLPTLAFNGFYGVIGATGTGLYHGVFNAQGSLKFPIFREAEQRGQEEAVQAQLTALRDQESSLRQTIDQQIRAAMLDVNADRDLVKVSQSNVELAQQELLDARDRFAAGVEDNLAVVDAEAVLAGAQSQLVQSLFQYNVAKLNLARNIGVVETRYRGFLGPLTTTAPAGVVAPGPIGPATTAPAPPAPSAGPTV